MTAEGLKLLDLNQRSVHEEIAIVSRVVYYLTLYSKTWNDDFYREFVRSFNEYLKLLAPTKYIPLIPSLVERLAEEAVIPLWESGIDHDNVLELLEAILAVKRHDMYDVNAYNLRNHVKELLYRVGVDKPEEITDICDHAQHHAEECLSSIAILALIMSTNP